MCCGLDGWNVLAGPTVGKLDNCISPKYTCWQVGAAAVPLGSCQVQSVRGSQACQCHLVPYLGHHGFFVLLLLCDFNWRLLGNCRYQEVHQNVFAVRHMVHHCQQSGWDVVSEQVVVVSANKYEDRRNVICSDMFCCTLFYFSSILLTSNSTA